MICSTYVVRVLRGQVRVNVQTDGASKAMPRDVNMVDSYLTRAHVSRFLPSAAKAHISAYKVGCNMIGVCHVVWQHHKHGKLISWHMVLSSTCGTEHAFSTLGTTHHQNLWSTSAVSGVQA